QVVELVRPHRVDDPDQRQLIEQVRRVQEDAIEQVLDAPEVGGAGAAHQAVDLVALLEEQFREIRAVLAGNPGNQCPSVHNCAHTEATRDRKVAGSATLPRTRTKTHARRNPLSAPIRMWRGTLRDSGLSGGSARVSICRPELRPATSSRADS